MLLPTHYAVEFTVKLHEACAPILNTESKATSRSSLELNLQLVGLIRSLEIEWCALFLICCRIAFRCAYVHEYFRSMVAIDSSNKRRNDLCTKIRRVLKIGPQLQQ